MSMIDKKLSFIQGLSEKAPEGSNLKVGMLVKWKNDYGVEFHHKILGFDYNGKYSKEYKKYVILDKESYWFPLDHLKIKKV